MRGTHPLRRAGRAGRADASATAARCATRPSSTRACACCRATHRNWHDEADIGIRAAQPRRLHGRDPPGRGLHHRRAHAGRRSAASRTDAASSAASSTTSIGLDVRTADGGGVEHLGALHRRALRHRQHRSNPTQDRFGVRLSAAPGAYVAHNRHVFDGPGFELQRRGHADQSASPSCCEVNSRAVWSPARCAWRAARPSSRATPAARRTMSTRSPGRSQGYLVDVDYTPTATRVGAVVRALHQAAPHSARRSREVGVGAEPARRARSAGIATQTGASRSWPACPPTCRARPPRSRTSPSPRSTATA